jgi:hypothetical protein
MVSRRAVLVGLMVLAGLAGLARVGAERLRTEAAKAERLRREAAGVRTRPTTAAM